jgi:hypothetical protein
MKKYKEKSFIRKISPNDKFATRTLTALIAGSVIGDVFGMYLPWAFPLMDSSSKKSISWKDTGDYLLFKLGAMLANPQEIERVSAFVHEKYHLFEPYLEKIGPFFQNLHNYF